MSIADKITSIENHLSADYEGLTNLGIDLTNINKNIENIKPCLDTIWNNLPKVSDTGTEVTLSPTLKGKLGIVEKGNSKQDTTTGKNLLKNIATTQTINGVTFTVNEDKSVTMNGTATANIFLYLNGTTVFTENINAGSYRLSGCTGGSNTTYQLTFEIDVADSVTGQKYFNCRTASIPVNLNNTTNTGRSYITVFKNVTVNNVTIYPMLEAGTTPTDYEQYTGGNPAPNPEFPFPIRNVTGENEVVIKNSDNTLNQTKPLSLGDIELNGIGDYKDLIFKNVPSNPYYNSELNEGSWYKKEEIVKKVFDGTETWWIQSKGTDNWQYRTNELGDLGLINNILTGLCNLYIPTEISTSNTNQGIYCNGSTFIAIRYGTQDTIENFKAFLEHTNLILYGRRNTPTDIEITNTTLISQLEDIDKLMGYNGTTIITSTYDSNNAQMILEVSSLKGE